MTVTEVSSVFGLVVVIGGGTIWLETRYVSREDVQALEERIIELEGAVDNGHKRAELRGNMFTIQKFINDLSKREAMYRAFDEVGAITPEQRGRWQQVREDIAVQRTDLQNLANQVRSLE